MARPRTPTAILQASGAFKKNPQRAREREHEPQYEKGLGEPPPSLSDAAKEVWREVAPRLEEEGSVVRVEREPFACYCQAVAIVQECQRDIEERGVTISTSRGLQKNPAVSIQREFMANVARLASEFGLTPASRSKVKLVPIHIGNEFADA